MLYKFKSRATADVIMLQANGDQILQIIGKDPAAKGIISPEQMPTAIAALREAIVRSQAAEATRAAQAASTDKEPANELDDAPPADPVSLHQRAAPFIDMLERCHAEDKAIVWGV